MSRKPALLLLAAVLGFSAGEGIASESIQISGFAFGRAASRTTEVPFEDDGLYSEVQLGLDWRPTPQLGAHLHFLAREDADESKRGNAGLVEAFLEGNFAPRGDRLRILAGAFFLPTSRENVDALWETPYAISSSALNSWFGEEFRPVGIDAAYTHRGITAGATLFSGNDTFGALPAVRGWMIRDRWSLLGEHLAVESYGAAYALEEGHDYTSVSAETDDRLGYSARARWSGEHALVQYTWIDNRSDGLRYGRLLNWDTRFHVVAGEYSRGEWTAAAESGWGVTSIVIHGRPIDDDIDASYVLLSRRLGSVRVSVRHDWFTVNDDRERALIAAALWSPRGPWRAAIEAGKSGESEIVMLDLRYHF